MASSCCQYCSRSLPETSARLPAETKVDRPSPREDTESRIAEPSAPDWQKNPTRPGGGIVGASEALSRTSAEVLMMPRQLGPISRSPWVRHRCSSSCWRARPSGPSSANPAEITIRPWTPLAAQSSTTSFTCSAGTATIAMSTSPGMSRTVGYAGMPETASAWEFTA